MEVINVVYELRRIYDKEILLMVAHLQEMKLCCELSLWFGHFNQNFITDYSVH